ncbi:MAG: thioesterase family protein [Pseudomonadota bacterium]
MTADRTEFALDRALQLQALDDSTSHWRAGVTTDYCNTPKAAFGGWINALAYRAIASHSDSRGTLQTMQTSFMGGLAEGDVTIKARLLVSRRATDFWRVDMMQNDALMVSAQLVFGLPRKSGPEVQIAMPEAAPAEESQPLEPAPPLTPLWMGQYRQWLARGTPFRVNPRPESWLWIQDRDERPLDLPGLIAMVDAPMPRTFFVDSQLRMGSTIQMQNHVVATPEQIAAAGAKPIMLRADSSSIANGFYDQRVDAWSADGQLLMISNQMAAHR